MSVLIALQKSLYRLYAYFEYGTPDIRKLTKKDKDRVEIVCTVEKGSADIKALILQATNNIIQRMYSWLRFCRYFFWQRTNYALH